jgi:hypothetical protein
MSLKDSARDWLKKVVGNHVGKNIRRYEFATYLGEVRHNSLGGVGYLQPIEGTVVDASDLFTLVKTSTNKFCVILSSLLSAPVDIGVKVSVQFYNLRRFDGTLADGSEDASIDGCRTVMLTGTETKFPVKWEGRYLGVDERFQESYREIKNPYLRDLIMQMERIPVNGGMRRIVNVLVDAGATALDFVDPPEEQSAVTPPAIRVKVDNKKFVGAVEVFYDRAADTYGILLTPTTAGEERVITDVHFNELGDALQVCVDDETWMQAKVTMLKPARKPKVAAPA